MATSQLVRRAGAYFLIAAVIAGISSPPRITAGAAAGNDSAGKNFYLGKAAFSRKDYAAAYKFWSKAAVEGSTKAMANIGYLYNHGWGVPRNYHTAANWYHKAAAAGDSIGMYALGVYYETGKGYPRNYESAVKWYRLASAGGVAKAMYAIGRLYMIGHGLPENRDKALKWFRKAARAGDRAAMLELFQAYRKGLGVTADPRKAKMWYRMAVASSAAASFPTAFAMGIANLIKAKHHVFVIHHGFGGQPCKIAFGTMHGYGKSTVLVVGILSSQSTAGLAEWPADTKAGTPGELFVMVNPHGRRATTPEIFVNKDWQLGGSLGQHSFIYRNKAYTYNSKDDAWVPASRP